MSEDPQKKRGRKRTSNLYFGPEQETAVVNFLNSSDDDEKNKIFNTYLRAPLNKMIESIIRRYKLYCTLLKIGTVGVTLLWIAVLVKWFG